MLALQFDDAREREKLAKRVSHRTWQKACRTQYLQGKWNVGRMGAQTSCQGDAGKVSFEFSSLLWRFPSLGEWHRMCECGGILFESVLR